MSDQDIILSLEHLGVRLPKGADRLHALSGCIAHDRIE